MSTPVNVTLIGAGSAQFSLAILKDLVLANSLAGSKLTLMDIDEKKLRMVEGLVRRYAEEIGADLHVHTSTDLGDALRDAQYVINTALAGGHSADEADRSVAENHGYYRGLYPLHIQKNLLLMLTIAQTMEKVCPDAWLIEAANPVFDGCTLMTRETSIKIVGLCHGYQGYLRVAEVLGLDPARITWQAPGFNHIIYLTDFRYDNESIYPRLDRWIADQSEQYWAKDGFRYSHTDLSRAAIDTYHRVGYLPLGDTTRGFDTWWYNVDFATKQYWWGELGGFDSREGWQAYLDHLEKGMQTVREAVADTEHKLSDAIPLEPSREHHIEMIESLATGVERILQVNMPNNGAITGIADDIVVEGKGLVSGAGVQLLHVGPLPEHLFNVVFRPREAELEQTVRAFQNHDLRLLREVILTDHRTRSVQQVDDLLADSLRADYHRGIADWYRVA